MPTWVTSPHHRALIASLVDARKAAGLTQREVASRLGKPPSFVGKIESIERNLNVLEFMAWCSAIDAKPEDILHQAALPDEPIRA